MTPLLRPQDEVLWAEAKPYLDVRNNDEHTLVAYGVAKSLLAEHEKPCRLCTARRLQLPN